MRPAYRLALVAGLLLIGVLVLFTLGGEPANPPTKPIAAPLSPRPKVDPKVQEAAREKILDDLEAREASEVGKAEAARRRNHREQLLNQRPDGGMPTPAAP
ncbi:MAG: hypothetical protein AAGA48_34690 [Myxococcota bacterium]